MIDHYLCTKEMALRPVGLSYIYTDHHTLENFDTQKDLLQRQLQWQEFMSQYDMRITYIRGEDNTVVDALSRLPLNTFPDEIETIQKSTVNTIQHISSDASILAKIKSGYLKDNFCKQVASLHMKGWQQVNGLWNIGDCLLIP
jgi:hypothetical protein